MSVALGVSLASVAWSGAPTIMSHDEVQGLQGTGGEGGIRTLDTGVSPYNGLANRRLQPLGHLSGV